jgi:Flp pilus assembly protein TadD
MRSWLLASLLGLSCSVFAQQQNAPPSSSSSNPPSAPSNSSGNNDSSKEQHAPSLAPPRSDRVQVDDLGSELGQSSSKDTQEDLSAPADDAATHPKSSSAIAAAEASSSGGNKSGDSGITEMRAWDPHKAAKSVEVGDFYFRRKNYRAAEDRYREALTYKENDAIATFRLAICLEKLELPNDARQEYESYLKILPHGPEAEQAQKAIDRLKAQAAGPATP